MAMIEAWIEFLGTRAGCLRSEVTEALRRQGITAVPSDENRATVPGVIVFDEEGLDSRDVVKAFHHYARASRVLALAASPEALAQDCCWRLLKAGASDVMAWETERSAQEIAARLGRWHAVDQIIASPVVQSRVAGRSHVWISVLRQIVEVAAFTDASVLILGESGTGKEEVARLIHDLDRRQDKRELVTLDCTTVVPDLSGSEFFGHERGAFTGAVGAREGAFSLANGGTLFLDEVGELPLGLQAQLLRAVQERTYKRVGGNNWHTANFRLVCATNRELEAEISKGTFRRDFFHRIANWVCRLPSLRERTEDIMPLARHFMRQFRPDLSFEMDSAVREYLLKRRYPGNVRDLRQLISRISQRHVGTGPLTVGDIPRDELPPLEGLGDWPDAAFIQAIHRALELGSGLKEIGRVATETAIWLVVSDEDGNLQRAARRLGVTDRALQLRKAQWGSGT
jgi:transcriptional regulator with GAF, ATPase, and Fis domain